MVLLSLSAVRKAFGTNEVIRDATLALQEGERLGLVGVNGSGKTTLLKSACARWRPKWPRPTRTRRPLPA